MPYSVPRCQVLPLPHHQTSFQIDGMERLRWHFAPDHPRPFFYPLAGPSGNSLTRFGHPGAANHDHHQSVWFAHHKATGVSFWNNASPAHIRQKHWLAYRDGDDEAAMAVLLHWHDGHDPSPLLEQELVAAVRPAEGSQTIVELQSTFRPRSQTFEFGQTNFGFLAVRVAATISEHFGGGVLTNSEGAEHEKAIFGQPARWMDYSGPMRGAAADSTPPGFEGVTYIDHPNNPNQPTRWHVREDGWMGASVCMEGPVSATPQKPLRLRYLLFAHRGGVDPERANELAKSFGESAPYQVSKATVKHRQYVVERG